MWLVSSILNQWDFYADLTAKSLTKSLPHDWVLYYCTSWSKQKVHFLQCSMVLFIQIVESIEAIVSFHVSLRIPWQRRQWGIAEEATGGHHGEWRHMTKGFGIESSLHITFSQLLRTSIFTLKKKHIKSATRSQWRSSLINGIWSLTSDPVCTHSKVYCYVWATDVLSHAFRRRNCYAQNWRWHTVSWRASMKRWGSFRDMWECENIYIGIC